MLLGLCLWRIERVSLQSLALSAVWATQDRAVWGWFMGCCAAEEVWEQEVDGDRQSRSAGCTSQDSAWPMLGSSVERVRAAPSHSSGWQRPWLGAHLSSDTPLQSSPGSHGP